MKHPRKMEFVCLILAASAGTKSGANPIINIKARDYDSLTFNNFHLCIISTEKITGYTHFMQGYMVGNAVTDEKFDENALIPFAHGMGLISDEIFEVI